ncbi:hypothetical protein OQJ26_02255 [Legionella sp. PATHC038]|uniref:hypothetical protein n=1 Tax=Legionella sheltonii TaxID=2992041 RepID=UPI002242DE25|nr:hypothetical protein [Legionella sp. PATHC038]MCW8397609.1 hypothetical protein [Legionella sp. PATHC038]
MKIYCQTNNKIGFFSKAQDQSIRDQTKVHSLLTGRKDTMDEAYLDQREVSMMIKYSPGARAQEIAQFIDQEGSVVIHPLKEEFKAELRARIFNNNQNPTPHNTHDNPDNNVSALSLS